LILNGTAGEAATIGNHLDTYAIGQNRWSVFLYHSEGGETNFNLHLDAIGARADDLWIAPFGEVARYIQQRSEASLSITAADADSVTLALTRGGSPDPDAVALTVALVWPAAAGAEVTIEQAGEALAYQQNHDKLTFAAVPDGGDIVATLGGGSPVPESLPVPQIAWVDGSIAIAFTSTGPGVHTLESSSQPTGPFAPVVDTEPVTTLTAGETHTFQPSMARPAPGEAAFWRIAIEP
jgi:hypothetical protein